MEEYLPTPVPADGEVEVPSIEESVGQSVAAVSADRLFSLMFSSGTAGHLKGECAPLRPILPI